MSAIGTSWAFCPKDGAQKCLDRCFIRCSPSVVRPPCTWLVSSSGPPNKRPFGPFPLRITPFLLPSTTIFPFSRIFPVHSMHHPSILLVLCILSGRSLADGTTHQLKGIPQNPQSFLHPNGTINHAALAQSILHTQSKYDRRLPDDVPEDARLTALHKRAIKLTYASYSFLGESYLTAFLLLTRRIPVLDEFSYDDRGDLPTVQSNDVAYYAVVAIGRQSLTFFLDTGSA